MYDSIETIHPHDCTEQQLGEICDKLYAIHKQVFDGVSKEAFVHYVVKSPADHTKLDIFKHRGKWVGYLATHDFSVVVDGEECVIRRGEAGMLKTHRHPNWATKTMAWDGVRFKLRHLNKRIFVLGCFVNPAMYYTLARFMYELYPSHRTQTPPRITRMMEALAGIFHLERVQGENPFVRRVGWQVKERPSEHERLLHSGCPEIEFYLSLNPHYDKGYGLEVLIPLSLKNLILSFFNSVSVRTNMRWRFTNHEAGILEQQTSSPLTALLACAQYPAGEHELAD